MVDREEIGRGEMVDPDGRRVTVVVRAYARDVSDAYTDRKPIKFVPMVDIGAEEDVAVYVPSYLLDMNADQVAESLRTLIHIVGVTMLHGGPEAVSRL